MVLPVNGFLGNFTTLDSLTQARPPEKHAGCSANVGISEPYIKYWSDGVLWGGLSSENINNLLATGLLSNVTYDSSNRAISWTIDSVSYGVNYTTSNITIAGSDGTITNIGLDPAQRITSVSTA